VEAWISTHSKAGWFRIQSSQSHEPFREELTSAYSTPVEQHPTNPCKFWRVDHKVEI
jgi:hypothetical protein